MHWSVMQRNKQLKKLILKSKDSNEYDEMNYFFLYHFQLQNGQNIQCFQLRTWHCLVQPDVLLLHMNLIIKCVVRSIVLGFFLSFLLKWIQIRPNRKFNQKYWNVKNVFPTKVEELKKNIFNKKKGKLKKMFWKSLKTTVWW